MFKEPDFYGYFAVCIVTAIFVLSALSTVTDKIKTKRNGKSVDTDKL